MNLRNMGAITKEQIENFSEDVLRTLRQEQWHMEWTACSGGLCLKKSKEILIPERMIGEYPWGAKEYVLHEIAHIFTEDNFHGSDFYAGYVRLLSQFMVKNGS